MLHDEFVDIQVNAAGALLRNFGTPGFAAVLGEMVRRDGDVDLDYFAMKFGEVAVTQHHDLYERAMSVGVRSGSDVMRSIVDDLIADFNGMQEPRNRVNADGSRVTRVGNSQSGRQEMGDFPTRE